MSARRPSIESATREGPVPSLFQRRGACVPRRGRGPIRRRPRRMPSRRSPATCARVRVRRSPDRHPTALDDPGSAKCRPERVPTEMHVRRIEEWEGPVGSRRLRLRARGGARGRPRPEARRNTGILRPAQRSPRARSPSAAGFHRPKKVRAPAHGTAHLRRCGDGPLPGGAAALGILDAVGRTVDVVDETNAFARKPQERW